MANILAELKDISEEIRTIDNKYQTLNSYERPEELLSIAQDIRNIAGSLSNKFAIQKGMQGLRQRSAIKKA